MGQLPTILLIEDDLRLAQLVSDYLSQQGFSVAIETQGEAGLHHILNHPPDLVLLDLMLPTMDGLTLCKKARRHYQGPILILTARDDDSDQIVGLELGADDYIKKPVDPRVLLARIRAILRRFSDSNSVETEHHPQTESLTFGSLFLDHTAQQVMLENTPVELTSNEFALLWALALHAGQAVTREILFQCAKGVNYDGQDRSVDITISRLRRKLGDNPAKPWRIKTVWSVGYLFVRDAWDPHTTGTLS